MCDAGWSKVSYGHNYNAKSCAGTFIELETKKIIKMEVANTFC